ncbi:MAG: MFS transporter [Actinomycetota bacterium]|nr:MFS transporter [Actinomycetota bacterium]
MGDWTGEDGRVGPVTPEHEEGLADRGDRRFGLLYLGSFISYGDRFAIAPLLVSISLDLGESLASVAAVASAYFLFYGAMQPVSGVLSDRVGRVRVLRWALLGTGVGNLAAAAAPVLGILIVAKAVAGAFAGAILPTALVYVGDKVSFSGRQRVIASVLSAGALGTFSGSISAGLLGHFATWRLMFAIVGLLSLLLAAVIGRLPESLGEERGAGPLTQLRRVARHPWALFLFALAVAEGAVILGFFTFLAPALEAQGESAAVAGAVVATYGVAVFVATQVVKQLIGRTWSTPPRLITIGGLALVVAYLVAATGQTVPNIVLASLLIGMAFAFLHSTLQTWATEVAPEARGTAISLFVTGVSTGAAIGTAAAGGLAGEARFGLLFLIAAVAAVPVATVAGVARARFSQATSLNPRDQV